jgi:hypothetical protein
MVGARDARGYEAANENRRPGSAGGERGDYTAPVPAAGAGGGVNA